MRVEFKQPQAQGNAVALTRPQAEAAAFADRLAQASPHEIIAAAASAMPARLAVVSSFGTESAVLLKFVADVNPALPVSRYRVAVQRNAGVP